MREKNRTLTATATLMNPGDNPELKTNIIDLIGIYELLRYGGMNPEPDATAELRDKVNALKNGF